MAEWGAYNIVEPHVAAQEMARKTYGTCDGNGNCYECGAYVDPKKRTQHANWHLNYIHRASVKDGFAVSAVKWCDAGDHAFKANAPGSQSIDVMQRNDDGREERVVMDMCAAHAFPTGQPKALPAIEDAAVGLQRRYEKLMQDRLSTPMNDPDVSPFQD